MRLFAALFRRKHMPPGNIYTGKHRIVKPVTKKDYCELKLDLEIEERNMFYLRNAYLTPEQSSGHMNELAGRKRFMDKVRSVKKEFYEPVPVEKRLAHLRYKENWE